MAATPYSTGQLAGLAGCSPKTVRRWIRSAALPSCRLPSGRGDYRIPARQAAAFLRTRRVPVPPEMEAVTGSSGIRLPQNGLLTTGHIARILGVDHRTVIHWIEADIVQAFRLPGGKGSGYRISRGEGIRLLRLCGISLQPDHRFRRPDELQLRRPRSGHMLSPRQFAVYAGSNRESVKRWIRSGLLKAWRLPPTGRKAGEFRIHPAECIRFMQDCGLPVPDSLRQKLAAAELRMSVRFRPLLTTGGMSRLCCVGPVQVVRFLETGMLQGFRLPPAGKRQRREWRITAAAALAFVRSLGMSVPALLAKAARDRTGPLSRTGLERRRPGLSARELAGCTGFSAAAVWQWHRLGLLRAVEFKGERPRYRFARSEVKRFMDRWGMPVSAGLAKRLREAAGGSPATGSRGKRGRM